MSDRTQSESSFSPINVPFERVDIADWAFPQRREDHEWGAAYTGPVTTGGGP
jgi:hypothetical protein